MRNAAFLLAAHGHCRKDTYFRLWIKDTAGEGDDVGQLVAHKPEWLLRDCGKVYVEEEDDVQDQQDQAEWDPDNAGVEQACSYLVPWLHMATCGTCESRPHAWQVGRDSSAWAATVGLTSASANAFMAEHLKFFQSKGQPAKGVPGTFYTNMRTGGRFGAPWSNSLATRGWSHVCCGCHVPRVVSHRTAYSSTTRGVTPHAPPPAWHTSSTRGFTPHAHIAPSPPPLAWRMCHTWLNTVWSCPIYA